MSRLIRESNPVRYLELRRYFPDVAERARVLRVSGRLIRALDDQRPYSAAALPAARVNFMAVTLEELETRLGSAEAAATFLSEGERLRLLFRNGGRSHQAAILAAAGNI